MESLKDLLRNILKPLKINNKYMEKHEFVGGCIPSPYDIRTFDFLGIDKAVANKKGGQRYNPEDILHQHKVGTCTATSMVQKAKKHFGVEFSDDFQYLMQKILVDNPGYPNWQWGEGSSAYAACKVGQQIGFLPKKEFSKWIKESDKKKTYAEYIKKLQAVPEKEIERLKEIAKKYRIKAYARTLLDRDSLAIAIDESKTGLITRYELGEEWWDEPIQPLRPPKKFISGHLVIDTNYDGNSFRIANTWGPDWADKGTAYRLHNQYKPTEAWLIFFEEVDIPKEIKVQIESRETIKGKILDLIQQIINLVKKL